MEKKYIFKTSKLILLLILMSSSLFAQVNDESFDGLAPSLRGLDYTTNGIRFQQISPNSISQMASLSESSDFIITPSVGDLGMLYNIDNTGTVSGPNIGTFDYRLGSSDGSEFKIVSMEADMSAKSSANGYIFTATVTGYRDGTSIITDNIDFATSDSNASVTYTKDSNPAANGGVLTFSSAWENIDEIRFTGGTPTGSISLLMIDDLDFSMPVLSIPDNIFNKNISIYPNPSKGLVTIGFKDLKNINLKVYNVVGEVVYQKNSITDSSHQFELNQASGIYFVQISNDLGNNTTFKVIKQ